MTTLSQPGAGMSPPAPPSRPFYHVGGTVPRDAVCYVTRAADHDLLTALRRGEFCYVLTARQMGKSSLMTRAAARLREEGTAVAVVDLTAFGRNVTPAQWYDLILARIGREFGLEEELDAFWLAHERLPPLARFTAALEQVVLSGIQVGRCSGVQEAPAPRPEHLNTRIPEYPRLVIFIDEIDVVRSLPFDTDELFAAIREFYTRRAREPELGRLSFCLLGVASPADLITDTRITPFNIGTRIELRDFTSDEALPLAAGLGGFHHGDTETRSGHGEERENGRARERGQALGAREASPPRIGGQGGPNAQRLLKRILYWTGGHPYLTQRLCQAVAERMKDVGGERSAVGSRQSAQGSETPYPNAERRTPNADLPPSEVDAACARLFFDRRASETEDNLRFVADRLLRGGGDVASILDLYSRALRGQGLVDDETDPLIARLRLSGVVRPDGGRLQVRNRIYGRVFDRAWIERQREPADLRRQRQAYRQGRNRALALAGAILAVVGGLAVYAFGEARRADRERKASQVAADAADLASYTASLNLLQREFESGQYSHVASLLEDTRASRHRGWEWGYWHRRMHQELRQLAGHTKPVVTAVWSPDGCRVVTGSFDKTARVWEAVSGRQVAVLSGHGGVVLSAAWSPDGRRVVTASEDNSARVWDAAATGPPLALLSGHQGAVFAIAWSPDGRRIVTASNDHTARVWDAASGSQVALLQGHTKPVRVAAWSPDSRRIVTAGEDGTARVWDAAAWGPSLAVLKHAGWVRTAAWSPDGRRIVTVSGDHLVRVWDGLSGRELLELQGRANAPVPSAAWSPDGRRILAVSGGHRAQVWDAGSGRLLVVIEGHAADVLTAAWSPDGTRIVTAMDDNTARVWDGAAGRELAALKHTDPVRAAAWSPDGKRILTTGDGTTALVWRAAPRPDVALLEGHTGPVRTAAWSPDGRWIASTSEDHTAQVWDAAGRRLARLGGPANPVLAAAWSPDARWIATAGPGTAGTVWDAKSGHAAAVLNGGAAGEAVRVLNGAPAGFVPPSPGRHSPVVQTNAPDVPGVGWSPDGRWLVTAGWDNRARVWDAGSGRELVELKGHRGVVSTAAWAPFGRQIVTASRDVTGRVWEIVPGGKTAVLSASAGAVTAAVWSPDGKRIVTASSDDAPRVWQVASGRTTVVIGGRSQSVPLVAWTMLASLRGHVGFVRTGAWSPDGQRIVTASDDHTARVWNAASGARLAELKGHAGPVRAAAWSPDGQRIVTGSEDRTARVWDAASGRELAALKHPAPVREASWSPDGLRMVTACDDRKARVWTSDPYTGDRGAEHGAPLR